MKRKHLRLRENIRCVKCGRRTTCFQDLPGSTKARFMCKDCRSRFKK